MICLIARSPTGRSTNSLRQPSKRCLFARTRDPSTSLRSRRGYSNAKITSSGGRDKHEYTKLSPVFKEHECTRIDDITHMSVGEIRTLAAEMGVSVSLGLVNRVFQYASADVAMVKLKGKVA